MVVCFFFFFNDTATTEIYTLSLHDALPISLICGVAYRSGCYGQWTAKGESRCQKLARFSFPRSEEHTSELQSRLHLVCRLLLEKKNTRTHRFVSLFSHQFY